MPVVEIEAGDMVEGALGTEENVALKVLKFLRRPYSSLLVNYRSSFCNIFQNSLV